MAKVMRESIPKLLPEEPWPDPPVSDWKKRGGTLDGAIAELRESERRGGVSGAGEDRLNGIRAGLRLLEIAAGMDSARCRRAVLKSMTEWTASGDIKLQIYELFCVLDGTPEKVREGTVKAGHQKAPPRHR